MKKYLPVLISIWAMAATLYGQASAGPAHQDEAETWRDQSYDEVERILGFKAKDGRREPILLVDPARASQILHVELDLHLKSDQPHLFPDNPAALGTQMLAKYLFDCKGILLIPENMKLVWRAENKSALVRMQALRLILAHACCLAILDSHVPFAARYYASGGSDAALADRMVWEGLARQVQLRLTKILGYELEALQVALPNTFLLEPPPPPADKPLAQQAHLFRLQSMQRIGEVGAIFCEKISELRGTEYLLEVMRKPPTRTSQLIRPEDYLDPEKHNPTNAQLAIALARCAGQWFMPDHWSSHSNTLGALSLSDPAANTLWNAGFGPSPELEESFDRDYVTGRSLVGKKRDGPEQRAAGLHLFRNETAAKRFVKWKERLAQEDWSRLKQQRIAVVNPVRMTLQDLALPQSTHGELDEALVLGATHRNPAGLTFTDVYFYLRKDRWVLELNLDTKPPIEMIAKTVDELLKAARGEFTEQIEVVRQP